MTQWSGGEAHKREMLQVKHRMTVIALARDSGSGTVTELNGKPCVDYNLCEKDEKSLLIGVKAAAQVMVAAGATRIGTQTQGE